MTIHDPTIRFYLQGGELRPAVVIVPTKFDYSKGDYNRNYESDLKQALSNPIFFKEKEDEDTVKELVGQSEYLFGERNWQPDPDQNYTIEGEVEIRDYCEDGNQCDCFCYDQCGFTPTKFAFLKPKEKPGYLKLVNEALDRPVSFSTIKQSVDAPGRNKAVTEAAAFVAMENILGKMLQMPMR